MQQDIALGRRIAKQAEKLRKPMHIRAFAAAVEKELDYDRFDSEDGSTDLIIAVCTAFLSYVEAGGSVDFGWRLPVERKEKEDAPGSEDEVKE